MLQHLLLIWIHWTANGPEGKRNFGKYICYGSRVWHKAPPKDHLAWHKLTIVLANRTFGCLETRVWYIWTCCPFPDVSIQLREAICICWRRFICFAFHKVAFYLFCPRRVFPFSLSGQTISSPTGVSICLEMAHMANWCVKYYWFQSRERKRFPTAIYLFPI